MISLTYKKIEDVARLYNMGVVSVNEIKGGLINKTYHISTESGNEYIFQELHAIFQPTLISDITVIASHLLKHDWDCPNLIKNKDGQKFTRYDLAIWRVYSYIDASVFSLGALKKDTYFEIGKLLGKLHRDLSELQYVPLHKISGFHDGDFYLQKAALIKRDLFDTDLREILSEVATHLRFYLEKISRTRQLIHGDPRIENILFGDDAKPYTFIDFDTFMMGSISIDIGDCLRSLMLITDKGTNLTSRLKQFVIGYRESSFGELNYEDAADSLKYITLELTLRFIIDAVEQNYFAWDEKKYPSAFEHNKVRAKQFWRLFNQLEKEL